jgi:hypothetical protein
VLFLSAGETAGLTITGSVFLNLKPTELRGAAMRGLLTAVLFVSLFLSTSVLRSAAGQGFHLTCENSLTQRKTKEYDRWISP